MTNSEEKNNRTIDRDINMFPIDPPTSMFSSEANQFVPSTGIPVVRGARLRFSNENSLITVHSNDNVRHPASARSRLIAAADVTPVSIAQQSVGTIIPMQSNLFPSISSIQAPVTQRATNIAPMEPDAFPSISPIHDP
eukprot:IDg1639t1